MYKLRLHEPSIDTKKSPEKQGQKFPGTPDFFEASPQNLLKKKQREAVAQIKAEDDAPRHAANMTPGKAN
ncbi:hypothetical protein NKV53_10350 [Legionella sp. 27cVA30]|uniref:hypothetical protein n=1 Tax=Legionella sp. 27cVA30 TaxID=2905657 RepID=UPI00209E1207|nr:hypothetical protein [Legionella sp. 27cVA30]MCP0914723.1 hypothetical protein [Legionella sp. 27cVA30]